MATHEVTMNVKSFREMEGRVMEHPFLEHTYKTTRDNDDAYFKHGRGERVRMHLDEDQFLALQVVASDMIVDAEKELQAASTAGDNGAKRVAREKLRRFNTLKKRLSAL